MAAWRQVKIELLWADAFSLGDETINQRAKRSAQHTKYDEDRHRDDGKKRGIACISEINRYAKLTRTPVNSGVYD